MNLIFYSYLILIVFLTISLSNAHKLHPYGQSITIQLSEDSDPKTDSSFNKLKEMFTHPEVANRKVVILSIIGAYRKGKSFFLDYCLRFLYANYRSIATLNQPLVKNNNWWGRDDEPLTGFSWKHGSEPDTKGILFWSDIFLHEQNGEKIAIILIDTQGLFESGRDSNIDAKIFGATNFITSIQIFNIRDVIQEDQLEHLKMVTDFAKLTTKRQKEKSLKSTFKPFQNLLFLFRDWDHEDHGYGYEGGKIYLENILRIKNVKNMNEKAQSVRNNIKDSYDNLSAFLLPSPGRIIRKKTFDGRWGPLDDEFKENFITLIESIFLPQNLIKKKVFGNEITAKELLMYTLSIFSAFHGSDLPENDSVFDSAVKIELIKLSEEAINEYMKKISQGLVYTNPNFVTKLLNDHKSLQMEVIENFKKKPKMADEDVENKFIEELKTTINAKFSGWKAPVVTLHEQLIAQQRQLDHQALVQRREGARRIYEKTPQYQSCRFFTMYMHDCGMTNNVNSVT